MITFAHRGFIQEENTINSIVNASFHTDWVECDVQVDDAGRVVLCHDRGATGELLKELCNHPFKLKIMLDIKAHGISKATMCGMEIVNAIQGSQHEWKLCSFNEFCVRHLLELRRHFNMSYGVGLITAGVPLTMFKHLDVDFISMDLNVISREIVDHIHSSGKQVYTYTIKNKKQEDLVESMGVDGVVKDLPTSAS